MAAGEAAHVVGWFEDVDADCAAVAWVVQEGGGEDVQVFVVGVVRGVFGVIVRCVCGGGGEGGEVGGGVGGFLGCVGAEAGCGSGCRCGCGGDGGC